MRKRRGDLAPNPALWRELDDGKMLRPILERFYDLVFRDERLLPFFADANQEWVVGKQHSFLKEIFAGEDCYFGARPRNAHHWMVISDDLFNYRERLFESVLREFSLSDDSIASWLRVHELFRLQIVKDTPRPLRLRGIDLPLEGYGSLTLDAGSLCDGCDAVLDRGQTAIYHVRTGKAYCESCAARLNPTKVQD